MSDITIWILECSSLWGNRLNVNCVKWFPYYDFFYLFQFISFPTWPWTLTKCLWSNQCHCLIERIWTLSLPFPLKEGENSYKEEKKLMVGNWESQWRYWLKRRDFDVVPSSLLNHLGEIKRGREWLELEK